MSEPIPGVTPIAYAIRSSMRRRPPMNWAATGRQVVFSIGIGLLAAGLGMYLSHDGQLDSSPDAFGFGATLVSLTMPWPGRVGRWREPPEGP